MARINELNIQLTAYLFNYERVNKISQLNRNEFWNTIVRSQSAANIKLQVQNLYNQFCYIVIFNLFFILIF